MSYDVLSNRMASGRKLYKETMVKTVRNPTKSARVIVHLEARIEVQGDRAKMTKRKLNTLYFKCGNDQSVTTDRVPPKVVGVLVEETT